MNAGTCNSGNRCNMSRIKAALAASLLMSFSVNAEEVCMQTPEVKADQVRFVETQMRVATLQCRGGGHRDMVGLYNDFVRSKRPYFIEAEGPLRTYLDRSDQGALEGYVVQMANRVSLDASGVEQFCDRARMALGMAVKMPDPSGLLPLMPVQYRQPSRSCQVAARAGSYYR